MGGRLVESLAVDLGKRSSDSSAIAMQRGVQRQKEREKKTKKRRVVMMTRQVHESIKQFCNI